MSATTADHEHHHNPTGWKRWAYSTNHKDIGTMYLIFAIIAGIIGSAFSVLMRMELMHPGDGILGGDYHLYNVLVTGHGLIMIFFVIFFMNHIRIENDIFIWVVISPIPLIPYSFNSNICFRNFIL